MQLPVRAIWVFHTAAQLGSISKAAEERSKDDPVAAELEKIVKAREAAKERIKKLREWLDAYHPEDGSSRWHSDQTHVVERLRFTDATNASYDVTIDDPKAYTRPWTVRVNQRLLVDGTDLIEFVCLENQKFNGAAIK